HTFAPGTYTVKLTVKDNWNVATTNSMTIRVNTPPTSFIGGATPLTWSNNVTTPSGLIDGSAAKDIDGALVQWFWNWGDGTTSTAVTAANGQKPVHKWVNPVGVVTFDYTITLTVTDNEGFTASYSKVIRIGNAPPTVYLTVTSQSGVATNNPNAQNKLVSQSN